MTAETIIRPDKGLFSNRRTLLVRGGQTVLSAAAVAILAGCENMAATKSATAASMSGDVDVLNTALGLEWEGIAAYQVGAESGLLKQPVLGVAVTFQDHHKKHADLLAATVKKLGGTPVEPKAKYEFPTANLKTQEDVLKFAAGLEQGAASAYHGAIPVFANKDLAAAAASIMADEAMHWAVLRGALGLTPIPSAFAIA
jgi:bacterioferritin (cytochrome b1)